MLTDVQSVDIETKPASAPHQQLKPYHFKPGVSGNPNGRVKGSRNKLGEAFVSALHDDFLNHGPEVITRVRQENPAQYLKVIAAVIPREFHVKDQTFGGVSDAEFASFVEAVRSVLGPGAEDSPRVIEGRAETTGTQTSDPVHGANIPSLPNSGSSPTNCRTVGESGIGGDRSPDVVGPTETREI